jgi:lipoprotein-anchoring transpeptidase ErfK/SrfK
MDLEHPIVRGAPVPDLDGALPYTYGSNLVDGTPLYRAVPARAQRLKLEPWLVRKPKPADDDDGATLVPFALTSLADAGPVAGDDDAPWWEKESPDGGPPQVTLEDLEENDGPVVRRMVKGFSLSLDKQFSAQGTTWWKTVGGLTAPIERISVTILATDFHGVRLGRQDATYATKSNPSRRIDKLPMAFIMNGHAKKWTVDDIHDHVAAVEGAVDHWQAVGLTGTTARVGATEYWETDEGWWLRAADAIKPEPGPSPRNLAAGEKWIDVNLQTQSLIAFEGEVPAYVTLVSTGRNEHETVTGTFRIMAKHITATMHGNADLATDGPYSIEDVPYIEYFSGGYALHAAFWHSSFGHVKSHGCVNLAPWDAKALFGWTEPELPEGWHGVVATKEHPGTRIVVHGEAPGTCRGPTTDVCDKNQRNDRASARR